MKDDKVYMELQETNFQDWDRRTDRMSIGIQYDKLNESRNWIEKIPYIQFPAHWQVRIIPPFAGAMIRFVVKTANMEDDDRISVYLDCHDSLGACGEPYWEVYAIEEKGEADGCRRFLMDDTEGLIRTINEELKRIEDGMA